MLLQSSPRDRRLIFEEAAGISRFKAKKIEALRRLERVEQNLLRLSDIVDEVESRLRGVRHAGRQGPPLQGICRPLAGAAHPSRSGRLAGVDGPAERRSKPSSRNCATKRPRPLPRPSGSRPRRWRLELEIVESPRTRSARAKPASHRIANGSPRYEATIDHERRASQRSGGGSRPLSPAADRHESAGRRPRRATARRRPQRWPSAEPQHREVARRVAEQERALTRLTAEVDELRAENEQRRAAHLEQLRAAAALGNQISALESQVARPRPSASAGDYAAAELAADRDVAASKPSWPNIAPRWPSSLPKPAARASARRAASRAGRQRAAATPGAAGTGQLARSGTAAPANARPLLEELERRLEGRQRRRQGSADESSRGDGRALPADSRAGGRSAATCMSKRRRSIEVALGERGPVRRRGRLARAGRAFAARKRRSPAGSASCGSTCCRP